MDMIPMKSNFQELIFQSLSTTENVCANPEDIPISVAPKYAIFTRNQYSSVPLIEEVYNFHK
jgi:hypothetical protein